MARAVITNQEALTIEHGEILERVDALLAEYDSPPMGTAETESARLTRLSRTIDEMPEIYRWLVGLWSTCDHWTDAMADQFGMKDHNYKKMRERRDLFEKMASAAKMRYESASRVITILSGFDPTGMPRSRRGPDG